MVNLLTLTVQSTHFYLIDFGQGKILVDAGWAGSLARLKGELRSSGARLADISYILATHYHPDHGGLVQELKRASGANLVIHERQLPGLEALRAFYTRKGGAGYLPIQVEKGDLLLKSEPDDNRAVLQSLGIDAVIVETPGHSEDSVTLVLNNGWAFTGDLHPPDYAVPDAYETTCESWKKLLSRGAQLFYPAHANPFPAQVIQEQLNLT